MNLAERKSAPVQCPQCRGRGEIRFSVAIGYQRPELGADLRMDCPLCLGDGETSIAAECCECGRTNGEILVWQSGSTAVHANHESARAVLPALRYGAIL